MPHRRLILDVFIAAVLLTILSLTSSFFIQALVDDVFILGRTPALNWLGLGMLLVTLARAGVFGLRSYLLAHLSEDLPGLPFALMSIIITAAAMLWLNWELTLRAFQLMPAWVGIVWLLKRRLSQETAFVFSVTVSHFVTGVSALGLLWFGGHQVVNGQLTIGQLLALHTMFATIVGPIEQFVQIRFSARIGDKWQDLEVFNQLSTNSQEPRPNLYKLRPSSFKLMRN